MKHVFGPVPSRRLGRSLGIDTVPFKTCNWNCVYCQLGRTTPLTNERKEFFPAEEAIAEVSTALASHEAGGIDWVTFVGSGETTLHSGLGRMIRAVKAMTLLPVAVITNGSLQLVERYGKKFWSSEKARYRGTERQWHFDERHRGLGSAS